MMPETAYELDVKNMLLHHKHLFCDSDSNAIAVFEKKITSKTRADCLIFTDTEIIGIEIKTAHDSKDRLPHQIRDYLKVCDRVYIVVHDSLLYETTTVLDAYPQVGIIAYSEAAHTLFPGVIREATLNMNQDLKVYGYYLMWRTEVTHMAKEIAKIRGDNLKVTRKRSLLAYLSYHNQLKYQICQMYLQGSFDTEHHIDRYRMVS